MTEAPYEVLSSVERFRGRVLSMRSDEVRMSDGSIAMRDVVEHPGAVAVAAIDDEGRIILVRQYRHPVGRFLDELPAGLLDVEGESPLSAAARELAEEARLSASRWHTLVDLYNSPGGSDEAVRVYLARSLTAAKQDESFKAEHEELQLTIDRVPLGAAVARVLSGDITNAIAVAGILAAARVHASGDDDGLREPDAVWPARLGR